MTPAAGVAAVELLVLVLLAFVPVPALSTGPGTPTVAGSMIGGSVAGTVGSIG
jgi:hypothetical protein